MAIADGYGRSTAPQVSDEETQAQRGEDSCPGHLAGDLTPAILPSEPILERKHRSLSVRGDKKTLAVACSFC